jgi:hypothetical protein
VGTWSWKNPFPLRFGGRSRVDRIYQALRKALGQGGAGPDGGIEDLWERAQARAIAAAQTAVEHAYYQRWPHTMTSALSTWEAHFGLPTLNNLPDRQAAVTKVFVEELDATIPGLIAALLAIDPNFTIEQLAFDASSQMGFGRMFGPLPGAPGSPFGTGQAAARRSGELHNFSDTFVLRVRYVLPPNVTIIPPATRAAAEALLNETLPSWVDYELYNVTEGGEGRGFYLDGGVDGTSLLDQTAFG